MVFNSEELNGKKATVIGLLFGLLLLTVPSFIFFFCCILLWCLVKMRRCGNIFIVLAACIFVMLPWHIRNYNRFGKFFFVSTNGGINLLLGNSKNTLPNSGVNVDVSDHKPSEALNEVELDQHYRRAAFDYIIQNPVKWTGLYVHKFINYFNFRNKLYVSTESSSKKDVLMFISYYGLLALCMLRLILCRSFPLSSYEWLILILYIANGLFSALFFTRIRFRLPYDWLCIILAGNTISYMLNRKNESNPRDAVI